MKIYILVMLLVGFLLSCGVALAAVLMIKKVEHQFAIVLICAVCAWACVIGAIFHSLQLH